MYFIYFLGLGLTWANFNNVEQSLILIKMSKQQAKRIGQIFIDCRKVVTTESPFVTHFYFLTSNLCGHVMSVSSISTNGKSMNFDTLNFYPLDVAAQKYSLPIAFLPWIIHVLKKLSNCHQYTLHSHWFLRKCVKSPLISKE